MTGRPSSSDANSEVSDGLAAEGLYLGAVATSETHVQAIMLVTVSNVPTCENFTPHAPFWLLQVTLYGPSEANDPNPPPNLVVGDYSFLTKAPSSPETGFFQWASGTLTAYGSPDGCGSAKRNQLAQTPVTGGIFTIEKISFEPPDEKDGYYAEPIDLVARVSSLALAPGYGDTGYTKLEGAQLSMSGLCAGGLLLTAPFPPANNVSF